jgi:hypothetical protein
MKVTPRELLMWSLKDRIWVLCQVQQGLEVRLYARGKLVGLEPCRDVDEALAIEKRWRRNPPRWPPF